MRSRSTARSASTTWSAAGTARTRRSGARRSAGRSSTPGRSLRTHRAGQGGALGGTAISRAIAPAKACAGGGGGGGGVGGGGVARGVGGEGGGGGPQAGRQALAGRPGVDDVLRGERLHGPDRLGVVAEFPVVVVLDEEPAGPRGPLDGLG